MTPIRSHERIPSLWRWLRLGRGLENWFEDEDAESFVAASQVAWIRAKVFTSTYYVFVLGVPTAWMEILPKYGTSRRYSRRMWKGARLRLLILSSQLWPPRPLPFPTLQTV